MPEYFDCMRCGHMSLVSTQPPKCPKCGSGSGVIVTRPESAPGPAEDGTSAAPRNDPGSPRR
jgi:hypothetical protein